MNNINKKYRLNDMINKNQFIISKTEWVTIRTYIEIGLTLPVNEQDLRKYFNLNPDITLSNDFSELFDICYSIKNLAQWWNTTILPLIIKSVNNITSYGFKIAGNPFNNKEGYFSKLQNELHIINNYNSNKTTKTIKQFQSRCNILIKEVKQYEDVTKNIVILLNKLLYGNQQKLEGIINIQKRLKVVQTTFNPISNETNLIYKKLFEKIKKINIGFFECVNKYISIFNKIIIMWSNTEQQIIDFKSILFQEFKNINETVIEFEDIIEIWLIIAKKSREFTLNAYIS
ncbi:hypothetical protein ABE42_00840 [Bacillus thuringiensis]|uniref:Cry1518-35 n=2 Tax=Bacillus thuringiensis TaxID=1428 RepID=K9J9Z7_BACTU|nr:hypothetical protein [Bacillus thuringiensis]EKS8367218.1 hypothetical protein [Bacillus cereus]ADC53483.1 Cry1518-35 [Bacillus thuringiensis YBT-1518]AGC39305.1 hypothetical protein Cry6A-like protein [Bacillus thuringiensis YBT-1518]MBG9484777.1 hypothetical protein [Bacillus thuringiensis]MBG9577808.1 hypothetical protein [Bacillus thuringiensis]